MDAGTILKSKGGEVATVRPEISLEDAAKVMTARGIGCVVVVDKPGQVAGILSERDIVREIALRGTGRMQARVSEAMTHNVHVCSPDETIDELLGEMTVRRFRHIPVVDHGELVGIVSIGDVVKLRIAEAQMENEAMRAYITAA